MEDVFSVKIDTGRLFENLSALEVNEIPFVMARSLNKVANLAQANERKVMESNLSLRRKAWVLQGIKIEKVNRATRDSWSVIIEVEDQRSFLERMEAGQSHEPINGRHYLAIPNKEVFGSKIITRENPFRVANLNLKPDANGHIKGFLHTFMIRTAKGGLILQRQATQHASSVREMKRIQKAQKGRNENTGNRILYTLVSKSSVPVKLHFYNTITNTVNDNFEPIFNEAMDKAVISTMNR